MAAALSLLAVVVLRVAVYFWAMTVLVPIFGVPFTDPWHYIAASVLLSSLTYHAHSAK